MIKPFLEMIAESKDRFINKNKNLSADQKKEIIDFFKINRQAEADIEKYHGGWGKSGVLTYDDFAGVMGRYKSGRKSSAKGKRVRCVEKLRDLRPLEDYIYVKTRSREYCAYIPLNYETAQKFNKDKFIGTCGGPWCIGHSSTKQYFNSYLKRQGKVAIYVVGRESKWVVMIYKDNKKFDVWDVANVNGNHEIPDFDVKKELLTPGLKSLYDEVRQDFTQKIPKVPKKVNKREYDAAVHDWDAMADDIDSWVGEMHRSETEHWEEMHQIIVDTKEKYVELANDAEADAYDEYHTNDVYKNLKARVDSFKAILLQEPAGTGVDPTTGEAVWHIRGTEPSKKRLQANKDDYMRDGVSVEGIPYTRRELQAFIDTFEADEKNYHDDGKEDTGPDFSDRDDYLETLEYIDDATPYDVLDSPSAYEDVEWTDDIYDYEYPDYMFVPHADDIKYDDYFQFAEDWGYDNFMDNNRSSMLDDLWEIDGEGWQGVEGEDELENRDIIHPADIVEWARDRDDEDDD